MKFQTLLSITLLANVSVSNAQSSSPTDAPVDATTDSPTGSPSGPAPTLIPFSSFFPSQDGPTETPSSFTTPEPSVEPSEPAPSLFPFSSFFPSDEGPTETPSFFTTPEPSAEPSEPAPSLAPFFVSFPPSQDPVAFEDCASQPCDPEDSNACSCRQGLECRQRGFDTFLCSQLPRAERNRLSDLEGIGGAARGNRGRGRADLGD